MATLTIPRRVEFVRPATAFVVHSARALAAPVAAEPVFEVAVSEAITNAVTHGDDADGRGIVCQIEVEAGAVTLRIIGGGGGFALPEARLPEISRERIDAVPASGYGLPIMHAVFPIVRVINVDGRFGVELRRTE